MHPLRHTLPLVVLVFASTLAAPIETVAQDIPIMYPYGNTLLQGQSLLVNQGLISPNGQYTLILQPDGNLVEYFYETTATWATETDGLAIDHATLQTDGNFVLYDEDEQPRWASETSIDWSSGMTGWVLAHRLVLGDDGFVNVERTLGLTSFGRPPTLVAV